MLRKRNNMQRSSNKIAEKSNLIYVEKTCINTQVDIIQLCRTKPGGGKEWEA